MKLFDVYGWALPKLPTVLNQYKDNPQITNLVKNYYAGLQSFALWFLLIAVVLSLILFFVYYWPYNNRPGRHYVWQKWFAFLGAVSGSVFLLTIIVCAFLRCPLPALWWQTALLTALVNTLYAVLLYLVCSFVLCQIPSTVSKTNAYPFMKIKRK